MFNFIYITPVKAAELDIHHNGKDADYYKNLNERNHECENCSNSAWKLADTGLCFSCTTGETDASEDYELINQ